MIVTLPIPRFEGDLAEFGASVGGVQIRYELRWWPRLSGWYMRLLSEDGTEISGAHRVNAEARATYDPTAPGHPPGIFYWVGVSDASRREDLWDDLALIFIPAAP